jgi:hypothetical protein
MKHTLTLNAFVLVVYYVFVAKSFQNTFTFQSARSWVSAVRCTAANAAPSAQSSPGQQYWSGKNNAFAKHVERA